MQWDVDQRGVASMVDNAQNSKKLYEEMRRAGYEDSEFPAWWYSPARNEVKDPANPDRRGQDPADRGKRGQDPAKRDNRGTRRGSP